jgi:hypothetical protein
MEQFLAFVQTFGLATVLLVGLLIGLYKLGWQVIDKIGQPLVAKGIEHMNKSMDAIERMSLTMVKIDDRVKTMEELVSSNDAKIMETLGEVSRNQVKVAQSQQKTAEIAQVVTESQQKIIEEIKGNGK